MSNINSLVGSVLLLSVALGAGIVMWQTAYGDNPVVHLFTAEVATENQS